MSLIDKSTGKPVELVESYIASKHALVEDPDSGAKRVVPLSDLTATKPSRPATISPPPKREQP